MKVILLMVILCLTFLFTINRFFLKLIKRLNIQFISTLEDKHIYVWFAIVIIAGLLGAKSFYFTAPKQELTITVKDILTIILVMSPFWFFSGYKPSKNIKGILIFCLIFPIGEEILFRGIIQSIFTNIMGFNTIYIPMLIFKGVTLQVLMSAICFGIMHFQYFDFKLNKITVKKALFAFIFGLFAGNFVELTNSILYTVIFHIIANVGTTLYYIFSTKSSLEVSID